MLPNKQQERKISMKKRIITGIIILLLGGLLIGLTCCSFEVTGYTDREFSKDELTVLITETQDIKDNAHTMAKSARELGWTDDDKLIKQLKTITLRNYRKFKFPFSEKIF